MHPQSQIKFSYAALTIKITYHHPLLHQMGYLDFYFQNQIYSRLYHNAHQILVCQVCPLPLVRDVPWLHLMPTR